MRAEVAGFGPRVTVAPAARVVGGLEVAGTGSGRGTLPRGSRRQRGGPSGEAGPARLVRIAGWQGHLDPGDHLGDPGGDLDQGQADGVELGVAPERGLWRQTTQRVQEPVGSGVDQQANWLAVALVQEVRSKARWSLCALIRFSARPRAQ